MLEVACRPNHPTSSFSLVCRLWCKKCISRRSCGPRDSLSGRQSSVTPSRHTTMTRSGKPDSRRGSRKTVARQPRGMSRGIARRNDSTRSCSGPGRVFRKRAPTALFMESLSTKCRRGSATRSFTTCLPRNCFRRPVGIRCCTRRLLPWSHGHLAAVGPSSCKCFLRRSLVRDPETVRRRPEPPLTSRKQISSLGAVCQRHSTATAPSAHVASDLFLTRRAAKRPQSLTERGVSPRRCQAKGLRDMRGLRLRPLGRSNPTPSTPAPSSLPRTSPQSAARRRCSGSSRRRRRGG